MRMVCACRRCFSEYMTRAFHTDVKMSFGSRLADRD